MIEIIRSAHSFRTMPGCLRYSRSNVRAAFFLTNAFEVLQEHQFQFVLPTQTQKVPHLRGNQESVNLRRQGFSKFSTTHIGHGM